MTRHALYLAIVCIPAVAAYAEWSTGRVLSAVVCAACVPASVWALWWPTGRV